MKRLRGRIAVVTGAANGIGKGLAEELGERGAKLVLIDIDEPNLQRVTRDLVSKGVEVLPLRVDVASALEMEEAARLATSRFGAVHILVNNAGVGVAGSAAWEVDLEDWRYIVGVNLMGVVHGLRAFMPILLKQDEGHVVNTASITGLISNTDGGGAYPTTKHAVVGLSEAIHLQLKSKKARVKVSVLCPGEVRTDISNRARRRYESMKKIALRNPLEGALARAFRRWIAEEGMDPRRVAQETCDAILQERFYVLTHDYYAVWIKERMDNILQSRSPEPQSMSEGLARRFFEEMHDLIPPS